jgi:hypothetical protein
MKVVILRPQSDCILRGNQDANISVRSLELSPYAPCFTTEITNSELCLAACSTISKDSFRFKQSVSEVCSEKVLIIAREQLLYRKSLRDPGGVKTDRHLSPNCSLPVR